MKLRFEIIIHFLKNILQTAVRKHTQHTETMFP